MREKNGRVIGLTLKDSEGRIDTLCGCQCITLYVYCKCR